MNLRKILERFQGLERVSLDHRLLKRRKKPLLLNVKDVFLKPAKRLVSSSSSSSSSVSSTPPSGSSTASGAPSSASSSSLSQMVVQPFPDRLSIEELITTFPCARFTLPSPASPETRGLGVLFFSESLSNNTKAIDLADLSLGNCSQTLREEQLEDEEEEEKVTQRNYEEHVEGDSDSEKNEEEQRYKRTQKIRKQKSEEKNALSFNWVELTAKVLSTTPSVRLVDFSRNNFTDASFALKLFNYFSRKEVDSDRTISFNFTSNQLRAIDPELIEVELKNSLKFKESKRLQSLFGGNPIETITITPTMFAHLNLSTSTETARDAIERYCSLLGIKSPSQIKTVFIYPPTSSQHSRGNSETERKEGDGVSEQVHYCDVEGQCVSVFGNKPGEFERRSLEDKCNHSRLTSLSLSNWEFDLPSCDVTHLQSLELSHYDFTTCLHPYSFFANSPERFHTSEEMTVTTDTRSRPLSYVPLYNSGGSTGVSFEESGGRRDILWALNQKDMLFLSLQELRLTDCKFIERQVSLPFWKDTFRVVYLNNSNIHRVVFPKNARQLSNLRSVSFRHSSIVEFGPYQGLNLAKGLKTVDLEGTPFGNEMGITSSKRSEVYSTLLVGGRTLRYLLAVIFGSGYVGKTSLYRLLSNDFKLPLPSERTSVVHAQAFVQENNRPLVPVNTGVTSKRNGSEVYVNFFDFGGQTEQRNYHPLFLSSASLAILVFDARILLGERFFSCSSLL
jgi:hypothetical protein